MKTLTKITALFLLLISTTSCFMDGITGIKGNRNVVSEDRTISSDFENIKVQQGINLYITQNNSTEIKVEADENIMDLLITEVQNNELKIYFEKNVYRAKARNVFLSTGNIKKIRASSGASVKSENTIQTNSLDLDASSGSSMKIYVNDEEVTTEASSGANINVNVTGKLTAKASSGGDIDYEGSPTDINKDTSSGGSVSGS